MCYIFPIPPRGALPLTTEDPTAFAPPSAFGPFRVLHQIGVGALGPVFRTYEPTRDRLVAVKVFRLDITPEQAQALSDQLSRAADASLFHPSIVEPIAAGVEGTSAYRAEEYVAAESLDVAMRHYAPASIEKALPFITQLAGAIDFARAAGVGHGALHPRDIFVTPDEARATGFGVAEALESVGLRAPVRRPYTPPERVEGGGWNTTADVFSLAAIAYELLTGRRPAGTGDRIGAITEPTVAPNAAQIQRVLARAMSEHPAQRYPNALAFASALEAAARGERVTDAVTEVATIASARAPVPAYAEPAPEPPLAHPAADAADVELARVEPHGADAEPQHEVHAEPPREDHYIRDSLLESADEGDVIRGDPRVSVADGDLIRADPRLSAAEDDVIRDDPRVSAADEDVIRDDPRVSAADGDLIRDDPRVSAADEGVIRGDPRLSAAESTADAPRRTAVLPLALTLIFGLLLGFAAGYAVGGRDRGSAPPETTQAPSAQPPAAAPAQPAGKEWSEQAVKPPVAATQQPPSVAPQIPNEAPSSDTAPAVRNNTPARPAPVARVATTGTLIVRSTPSGAGVTINGRWRGRTPLTLERLPFARYTVRVVQPGYAVAREEIGLSRANASRTMSFALRAEGNVVKGQRGVTSRGAPAPSGGLSPRAAARGPAAQARAYTGAVFVASNPPGARVFLDGKPVGTAPVRVPDVPIGSHVVRMELPEHRTWTDAARVVAGQELKITGSLERIQ